MAESADDVPAPYSTLADLRLALPCILVGLLLLRWLARGFVAVMGRIQAQGWTIDDDEYAPPERTATSTVANKKKMKERNGAAAEQQDDNDDQDDDEDEEDQVTPVVVKQKRVRRALVLGLTGLAAVTYFAEGVAQVIASMVTSHYTPADPLYANVAFYTVGGLGAFSMLGVGMAYEAKWSRQEEPPRPASSAAEPWPKQYPRLITFLALAGEVAVLSVFARIVARDQTTVEPKRTVLPIITLALVAFRILVLLTLLAFQFPPFYRANFVAPNANEAAPATERTPLLANANASANGGGGGGGTSLSGPTTDPAATGGSVLRGSRLPSNRPPDPKSLSILTLFSRVKLLFPYLWPAKSLVLQILALICFGLMLFRRYVNVLQPILFGRVISALANGKPPFVPIVLYVIFSFLQDSNTMLYRYLWLPIEQYSEREMALMSFDILLNLSLSYHTRRRTGELLRILSRSEAINDFFELLLFSFVPILIDLPVAFLVLWVRYGITIVGVVTVVAVVYVTTSVTLAESRTKLYRALRDESQFMHQLKSDVLFNYETTKIFVSENFEMKRLRDAMWKYQRGYFNVFNSWQSLSLLQNSISAFGLLVCSFILSRRVIEGEMDVGNYVAFVSYLNQLYSPLNQISSLYRRVMNNAVDTEQLIELLNEEREISDRPNPVELKIDPSEGAEIEFKDVTFSYDKKVPVLKGVSFKVGRGQSVALVGPSGGGKSTITKLIYRFYDVSSGSISINGHDIRDLTQRSLRASIGLVPQESVLFNSSARMNIAYGGINRLDLDGRGSERITMDEVVEAAKAAAIHDKIMSFPDQYETIVGERGQRLSGGEKQRVSIARTILKDPPILVLDEATSALDTFNERLIQNRLRELLQGRTSIIIAHRLSTIVDCDVIHVLKDGLIVESGSHNELIARGGVYAELWQKQIEGQESSVPASKAPSGAATPADPRAATPDPTSTPSAESIAIATPTTTSTSTLSGTAPPFVPDSAVVAAAADEMPGRPPAPPVPTSKRVSNGKKRGGGKKR
ncbi:hypothetical protein JCM8115_006232 [Rhodotorula mucilaginosa]|uniref:Uncharacterized protein n=1 Tax=Rhodotorula mucilaginosa TaxID=5537 RepID=A0A9P7B5N6_RHOMI|nr:hypothetical protein C6P46_004855 [Rhodotorula mucilaginosa]TKA52603.1 hypothetical protein B0A53_04613 [Rhodotorula sp. CCFEE 5036]